jgi:hypothetical protein
MAGCKEKESEYDSAMTNIDQNEQYRERFGQVI